MAPAPIVITANDGITTLQGEADFPSGPPPFQTPPGGIGTVTIAEDSFGATVLEYDEAGGFVVVTNADLNVTQGFVGGLLNLQASAVGVGFNGTAPVPKPTVAGALTTVADAPAKAVLGSIIAALVAYGLATDGTT